MRVFISVLSFCFLLANILHATNEEVPQDLSTFVMPANPRYHTADALLNYVQLRESNQPHPDPISLADLNSYADTPFVMAADGFAILKGNVNEGYVILRYDTGDWSSASPYTFSVISCTQTCSEARELLGPAYASFINSIVGKSSSREAERETILETVRHNLNYCKNAPLMISYSLETMQTTIQWGFSGDYVFERGLYTCKAPMAGIKLSRASFNQGSYFFLSDYDDQDESDTCTYAAIINTNTTTFITLTQGKAIPRPDPQTINGKIYFINVLNGKTTLCTLTEGDKIVEVLEGLKYPVHRFSISPKEPLSHIEIHDYESMQSRLMSFSGVFDHPLKLEHHDICRIIHNPGVPRAALLVRKAGLRPMQLVYRTSDFEYPVFTETHTECLSGFADFYDQLNTHVTSKADDALKIPVNLYLPKTHPYVTFIYLHGGPGHSSEKKGESDKTIPLYLASRYGAALFVPEVRGSSDYGYNHEHCHYGDLNGQVNDDIAAVVELSHRLYGTKTPTILYGESHGAYEIMCFVTQARYSNLATAAISLNGACSLKVDTVALCKKKWWIRNRDLRTADMIGSQYTKKYWNDNIIRGNPETDKVLEERISPVHHMRNLQVPLLTINATEDEQVSWKNYFVLKFKPNSCLTSRLVKQGHSPTGVTEQEELAKIIDKFLQSKVGLIPVKANALSIKTME